MTTFTRRRVQSSTVGSIGYDSTSKILEVTFRDGGACWHYYDVPPATYLVMTAEADKVELGVPGASVGKLFHRAVRGQYREARVRNVGEEVRPPPTCSCPHGAPLIAGGDDYLEPDCGCRLTTTARQAAAALKLAVNSAEIGFKSAETGWTLDETRARITAIVAGTGDPPLPEGARARTETRASEVPGSADPFSLSADVVRGGG